MSCGHASCDLGIAVAIPRRRQRALGPVRQTHPGMEVFMPQVRLSSIRRAASYAAFGALLGVASLTLSQCTQVGDSLTGVSRLSSKHTDCKHDCDKTFDALEKIERKKHQENLKQCGRD